MAIEVKLARILEDSHLGELKWLHKRVGDDLLDALLITTGNEPYRRADGIAVIPASLLGP